MRFRRVDAGLRDLLRSLVEALPGQQQRLDDDYRLRLEAIRALAARLGPEHQALVSSLVPSRHVISEVSISTEVGFTGSTGSEVGIGVELLSLGYRRKYEYSELSSSQVEIVVRQVPRAPQPEERKKDA